MNILQPSAWHPALISISCRNRSWLQDRGSLTRRIQARCNDFHVRPVFQSLAKVYKDEWTIMGLRYGELAMVREVYLYCGDTPVIFAHSVVARKDLRGAWRGLSGLGNRSLGTVLFTNPRIKRTPLEFKKLNAGHFLFVRACSKLQSRPSNLWARRSLFTLQGQSILVTEVYLPAILELTL
ncbi:chorismate lyase [Nitrosomonas cryotolerans]|uniref:Probable chorismate pyruvate-lyase n=1 Tax=Nitrosomonas cryotolerans ATCC 49181 TaxID=1131553 RepID=A0A1N6HTX4_9PROT|nr:chorismate lyase [Nitrosomonas cryotolerans]SFP86659.1 chorismate lyase [Nitrosomonas cryotolerans]SIO23318.1 chorismate lyase [Nitrosomonas cryotolerans ATCC 49181]